MLPSVLEIQVPQPGRAPQGGLRNHHFDPADRQGEQPVGRGAHPWRTHEARIRVANLPQVQAGGPQSRITSALHSPTPPMVRIGHPSSRITPSWSGPVTFSQHRPVLPADPCLLHHRTRVVHCGVTSRPTDAWVTQQLREATPYGPPPRFSILDQDCKYGDDVRTSC